MVTPPLDLGEKTRKKSGIDKKSKILTYVQDNNTPESQNYLGSTFEIDYHTGTFVSHDSLHQGKLPENSFVIVAPTAAIGATDYLLICQVIGSAPLPKQKDLEHIAVEITKNGGKNDAFTKIEMGWTGYRFNILGTLTLSNKTEFAGDVAGVLSPQNYNVIAPSDDVIDALLNNSQESISLGYYRPTETILKPNTIPFSAPITDFIGKRVGVFGLTRTGKSNLVKTLAVAIDETSESESIKIGQLLVVHDPEYDTDNIHASALSTIRKSRTFVYSLNPLPGQQPLKLNFWEDPVAALNWIKQLLEANDKTNSTYIEAFAEVTLSEIADLSTLPRGESLRMRRKLLYFYAILHQAGFAPSSNFPISLDPGFSQALRAAAYGATTPITTIATLDDLLKEITTIAKFAKKVAWEHPLLTSTGSGKELFDSDDKALLKFLVPKGSASGTTVLNSIRKFHDPNANAVFDQIIEQLDDGMIVIIDLSSSDDSVSFITEKVLTKVYQHQNLKLQSGTLTRDHYISIHLEEAQNLFASDKTLYSPIYEKLAKQGAKLLIGITYVTQSPSSIDKTFLDQTENIFVTNLSSMDEINFLCKINSKFLPYASAINNTKAKGYLRGITESTRFVVPFQSIKFSGGY